MTRKYGSNIPAAREALAELALEMRERGFDAWSTRINDIISSMMHQTSPDKRTTPQRNAPTQAQREAVLRLRRDTDMSQQAIADAVGLNPGRVSEIIHAEQRHDVPPLNGGSP